MKSIRLYEVVDTFALLLLTVLLIAPVFTIQYLDNWPSIESTFISDARLLAEHLPHPGWQPLWYCGTRFDYIYPPALRYGTTLISVIGHISTARAYHIYIGLTYVLGPVSVYWLVLVGSRSRASAWLSALAAGLVSPSLILFRALHDDSPLMIPQRLHVLMSYGEGPHISALSVLPAALAAAFVWLRDGSRIALILAAGLCAFTVANNFYGATALAIFFPVLVWSVWICLRDRTIWWRAIALVALAYGFSAFWLTPSYLQITWHNLKWVSTPGNTSSRLVMLTAIIIFCDVSWRWANRRPARIWPVFVWGSALIFSVDVAGFFYAGLRVLGEPARIAPEFDLALLLSLVLLITTLWAEHSTRIEAVVLAIGVFMPAFIYIQHAWSPFTEAVDWEDRYERSITEWVHENLPGERVLPSGTIRFWFDAWFDNAQPVGGSDQGILNQVTPIAGYQAVHNENGGISVLWLQAMGTSAVIVPDKASFETYHDYSKPEKFKGMLPVLFDDRHGTVIYRVPRVHSGLGRIVDRGGLAAIGALRSGDDIDRLRQYVSMIEAPGQSETSILWSGFDALRMKVTLARGQTVLLQETYDPAWHAYENGRPVPIRRDEVMGFMLIDLAPGTHNAELRFETPLENRIGQVLFAIAAITTVVLLMPGRLPPLRRAQHVQS